MNHPQIKGKVINKNYYGSDLNEFVATKCKLNMTANNVDLIFDYYEDNKLRIIESKHMNEKLKAGQTILLEKLSKLHNIETFAIYGDKPYDTARIYSFQTNKYWYVNNEELIKFLNNE